MSAIWIKQVKYDSGRSNDTRCSPIKHHSHLSQIMHPTPSPILEPPESSPPPQFGLRILFVVVTAICVALALTPLLSALVLGILVLLVVTVGAHFAASGLGHRLRAQAHRTRRRKPHGASGNAAGADELQDADFAPPTLLSRRRPLGGIVVIAPVFGGIVGATLGSIGMAHFLADKASLANVAVAGMAAGVLGAIGSFLLATFLKALLEANVEAWRHEGHARQHEPSRDKS